jgi:hypothetical protein
VTPREGTGAEEGASGFRAASNWGPASSESEGGGGGHKMVRREQAGV